MHKCQLYIGCLKSVHILHYVIYLKLFILHTYTWSEHNICLNHIRYGNILKIYLFSSEALFAKLKDGTMSYAKQMPEDTRYSNQNITKRNSGMELFFCCFFVFGKTVLYRVHPTWREPKPPPYMKFCLVVKHRLGKVFNTPEGLVVRLLA